MKKLLSTGAILVVLGLSGCNQMLEKLFPDEIGPGSIGLTVQVNDTEAPAFSNWAQPGVICAQLLGSDYSPTGALQKLGLVRTTYPAAVAQYTFDGLPDGSYYVHVWFDDNLDGLDNDPVNSNQSSSYWLNDHGYDPVIVSGGSEESARYDM